MSSEETEVNLAETLPFNHLGPIPGVAVGMRWKFRYQLSVAGVHRPLLGYVHAARDESAFCIIVHGKNTLDGGNEIAYVCDDMRVKARTMMECIAAGKEDVFKPDHWLRDNNLALARCCNAEIDPEGAESDDWQAGLPVRVVRCSLHRKKHSFCPTDGYRYDGIYKVASYAVEDYEGYDQYHFRLFRDDPEPAPWEENAKKYELLFPDDYDDSIKIEK
ncbi:E3 ubiquitin-protein ligase UHRF1-like [Diabrotica undecimpunctata]|uniref:E3 ubiquitin-protein ligase UHRF1-like n=1 Tax=Diabrotica undecimpunctata TaxID=50387 RepID=UPI003B633771